LTGRVLGVASTPRAKAQAPRRAAAPPAAWAPRPTRQRHGPQRPVACAAEAHPAAILGRRARSWPSQQLTSTVAPAWGPATQATRGRPPTDAPRPHRQGWRGRGQVQAATAALAPQAHRERRLVLATHGLDAQPLTAADLWRADKGPPAVELSLQGAKTLAAIAPIVLETPTRRAALGWVSVVALRGYPLVARHVRNHVAARGAPVPDRPAPRRRPTARTVFHRRRTLAVVTLGWAGPRQRPVPALPAPQLHVSGLLGYGDSISAPPLRNSG
jgi:hypothetical protein